MRKTMCGGAIAVFLLATGAASAQDTKAPTESKEMTPAQSDSANKAAPAQDTVQESQKQSFPAQPQPQSTSTAPDGTTPAPGQSQPQAPIADQLAPAAVGPAQAATTDNAEGPKAPMGSTRQTTPSTISPENAALDKLSTTAWAFRISDDQKKLIVASVANAPNAQGDLKNLGVANFVTNDLPLVAFSDDVQKAIPMGARYKYLKADGRLLVVDSANLIVVSEIKL
ncbi:MAG: hypothetical protein Q8M26_10385 [Pseudolabrys sp.]|nr:hypothetical protein [Pseudolabrys sp.]